MTEHFGNLASLPSFLSESELWEGMFSPKARLTIGPARESARRYLGSHRYGVRHGGESFDPPSDAKRLVLEIALSLLERGQWTLPSWQLEQQLAARARDGMAWVIDPATSASGDLRLKLRSRVALDALNNVLLPCPLEGEIDRPQVVAALLTLVDDGSPGERIFVEQVAGPVVELPWLCMLTPQRSLASMGLDVRLFSDQRVDFALETPQGDRLVIEIDGSQHSGDAGQVVLDAQRDLALVAQGWEVWRISTDELLEPQVLQQNLRARLSQFKARPAQGGRQREMVQVFWSATAASRIQALVLESLIDGAVSSKGTLHVAVNELSTEIAAESLADLDEWLGRLAALYGVQGLPTIQLAHQSAADLVVDIDVLHPLRPIPAIVGALAWSRPACRVVDPVARRIQVLRATPRFMPSVPNETLLDEFVRDLFRKDGFRRDDDGGSDQAAITCRILQGKDVVGLLPTGAGKSLPYMMAGLLLPGLTLYVGPLVSLLQDQAERLNELGIDHVEYISSALDQGQRQAALHNVQSQGLRFLLVSPERFLTRAFIDALNKRSLWQGDISQVVIDECHCVSEWGHEFRPAYLSLGRIARDRSKRFGTTAPLVGLTGTASTIVLSDVLRELGVIDSEACIRASNLDRREISMKCVRVLFPDKREQQIEQSVMDFLGANAEPADGVLVFCPFRGGRSMGVFSVASHLTRTLPGVDVRFYAGGNDPWRDFAVYALRKKKGQLSADDVLKATPAWAQAKGQALPWSQIKSEVQREFVSGTRRGFRVLVATKAFGMGIDKPSIRKVIHAVAPTSPEAFYQEIGRAGRDRKPSEAELLFCDASPGVTDGLLDPALSQPQAQKIYQDFVEKDPYGGGDFLRTYFFQNKTFSGRQSGVDAIYAAARDLHKKLKDEESLVLPFGLLHLDGNGRDAPDDLVAELEHAIVRLIHLGVVDGYFKDYNKRVFEIEIDPNWVDRRSDATKLSAYFAGRYETFVKRYQLSVDSTAIGRIAAENTKLASLYEVAAGELMDFVYQHIERQRRHATRQMLELARVGATNADVMRERLLNYLQVSLRYTGILEELEPSASPQSWIDILSEATSPQDLSELHGATQRVLESYPTHPGLLFIAAVSRSFHQDDDRRRSEEELHACVDYALDVGIDSLKLIGAFDALVARGYLGNLGLRPLVREALGMLYLRSGPLTGSVQHYLESSKVRHAWLSQLARNAVTESKFPAGETASG